MHSLGLLLLSWLLGYLFIDWRRIRQLLPAILTGMLLAGIPAALPGLDPPFRYLNTSQAADHWTISYLIQMGIAPVATACYAQGFPRDGRLPWGRVLRFTLLFWGLEQWARFTGTIGYTTAWGPLYSLVMKAGFLSLIALANHYSEACGSPHQRSDRSVREVITTGVLPSSSRGDMAAGPMDH